jgi:membrane protein DedA with SNARE-associated domain
VLSIELLASAHDNGWNLVGAGVLFAIAAGFALLFLAALVSVLRSRQPGGMKLVWVVFAFCAPFLGSLLWFVIGRRSGERALTRA